MPSVTSGETASNLKKRMVENLLLKKFKKQQKKQLNQLLKNVLMQSEFMNQSGEKLMLKQ